MEETMSDITFMVSIISSAVAGANTIAMVLMYRRYLDIARLSVTFAGEVIGHLHAEDDGTGEKIFDNNLSKRFKEALKSLKQISSVLYACEADAKGALSRYLLETPLVILVDSTIEIVHKLANGKRGRPKEGEALITQYRIDASIQHNSETIMIEREYLGRFILATNVLTLDPELILIHY